MPSANADLAVEQENIATSTTVAKEADFEAKCKGCILHCTEDAYLSFDRAVQTGDFFLKADTMFHFPVEFTRLSALAVTAGGTLYILAYR